MRSELPTMSDERSSGMSSVEDIGHSGSPGNDLPDEWLSPARQAAMNAVRAGQFAPTFRLPDIHGGNLALIDLIEQGPLVLNFFRGVWCDFCDAALETLAHLDGTIRDLGATQVAIGPAPGDDAQRLKLAAFPMPLLIDRGLRVASSYGLSVSLPEVLHEHYARIGYVPTRIGETGEWRIPVPATYIIDRGGRVVLAIIDADYRNRTQPGHLLSALRGLQRRQPTIR
jgi:peroxiredoxin